MEISFDEYVVNENETFRIDSEYFRKSLLEKIKRLKNLSTNVLECKADVKGGKRLPLGEEFVDVGIPYIRAEDVKNSFVQHENSPCISEETYSQIASYQTNKNDVLLTIVGNSIGDVGIVKFQLDRCNLTENCVKIVPKKEAPPYFSDYLFLFFMSNYGQAQIDRERVGTAQPKLAIERIRRFLVPELSAAIQHSLADLVVTANEKRIESVEKYQQAEQALLHALGLENWKPANQHTAIKNLSQSFASSGRFDAEYYQPKYDEILARIQSNAHGCVSLADCFEQNRALSKLEKSEYHYIEIGDVSVSSGQVTANCIDTNELPPNARIEGRIGDLIVSKVRPYRGAIAIVECNESNLLLSTAFTVLRETGRYKKEVLQVLLRTDLYKELLMQPSVGTSYPVIRDEDVMALPLPDLPVEIQQKISDKMQSAQIARRKSQQLLELAKQTVERAIENSEAEALAWLEVQLLEIE